MSVHLRPGGIADGSLALTFCVSTEQGGGDMEKRFEGESRSFHYVEFCCSGSLFELWGAFYVQFCDFWFCVCFQTGNKMHL